MKKKIALIITICVVVIGIVLAIVLTRGTSPESTPTAVNVTRGDIVKTVLADGSLEMPNKAYLSFGATGTVEEVLVDEGGNVTKDQVLARLDAPSLESSVEMAELQVEIAHNTKSPRLSSMKLGPSQGLVRSPKRYSNCEWMQPGRAGEQQN
ncbi:hypothetical protein ES703_123916 [subsurface metagenome]